MKKFRRWFYFSPKALLITLTLLALFALPMVTTAATNLSLTSVVANLSAPARIVNSIGRQQYGLAVSGSIAVWEDQAIFDPAKIRREPYATPNDQGSSVIKGFDFANNRPIIFSTAHTGQTAPSISGSVVVWQDSGHSCPTCERDIQGKDLNTGILYNIANGPADQTLPVVDGHTVAWVENGVKLVSANLDNLHSVQTISKVPAGTVIDRIAIDPELIVWSENTPQNQTSQIIIRAYDRKTGKMQVVAKSDWKGTVFALSARRVVWTNPHLNLTDLATGTNSVIDTGNDTAPTISDDTIIWSGRIQGDNANFHIFTRNLKTSESKALTGSIGNKVNAKIVGNNLLWQSDETGSWGIYTQPVSQALATTEVKPGAAITDQFSQQFQPTIQRSNSTVHSRILSDGSRALFTNPNIKGIHAPNGLSGWYNQGSGLPCDQTNCTPCSQTGCPAIDGLGAPFVTPLFGAVTVLSSDLGLSTGRSGNWGPTVSDAMRYMQSQGVIVTVRLFPTREPNSNGNVTPDTVSQDIINLAKNYDWIKNIQVNNEPNNPGDWNMQCFNCFWTAGNTTKTCTFNGDSDPNLYACINNFYSDVWYSFSYYQNNYLDERYPNVKARLQQMQLWSPPMSDIYKFISINPSKTDYDYMQGMISLYTKFSYHTYPGPNYDSDGFGGVINNSWKWFGSWLQTQINNGTFTSRILEFGWNPGQMYLCGLAQYSKWPGSGTCAASDGYTHTFENDVNRFLSSGERHGATVVTVWIERGNPSGPDSNGIDNYGNTRPWFHNYQFSSP